METRTLGNTGIEVTPLCYGCAAAYARDLISDDFSMQLFEKAYNLGIRFFDTGHSYGKAEERIGKALSSLKIKRDELVISTKFGTKIVDGKFVHDVSKDNLMRSLELSLKRMNVDYVDILYIHGPKIEELNEDILLAFEDLKRQKIIRATGANTFDTETINYISDKKCLDIVMLDYNIVRQDREPQIEKLYNNGIGIVAGQAMAESLFLNSLFRIRKPKDLWYIARTIGRKASRDLFFESYKYRFMNNLPGYNGSQVALKYVIDNKFVASAAVGTCSLEHLISNVDAMNICIPDEIRLKIKQSYKD